jgi:hypothetical protein
VSDEEIELDEALFDAFMGPGPHSDYDGHSHFDDASWPSTSIGPHNGVFWHRGVRARISACSGSVEAAEAAGLKFWRELQTGALKAVAIHPETGRAYPMRPEAYQATGDTGRVLRRSGISWVGAEGGVPCDIYLIEPESALEWHPGAKQSLKSWCAPEGPADRHARERMKARGQASPSEKAICAELFVMWRDAGREGGSPASIEITRSRLR